ncbi:C40 family peptidase [Nocardioides plantarum]|uniref:C40 family peptidase n=1 Tax=Nocardioides plantarum TaxID=29299 RepID=A0ABV5KBR9_9ACTN|nr:C40 family peptidase [Nocardioides plantarum]
MSVITRALTLVVGAFLFTAVLGGVPTAHVGTSAEAATSQRVHTSYALRVKAMKVALAQRGDPYRSGAAGPSAFDCSGLTKYSYGRLGRSLPRTTDQLKASLKPVTKSRRAPGDIIIFVRGGNAYHAGIYLGHNKIVHASRPGTPVKTEKIWTTAYVVRRP